MRLKDKIAIVVGAGQSPGEGTGNGRATAMVFAREGATVACVDMLQERAEETAAIIRGEGNQAFALAADVTKEASLKAMVDAVMAQCGRIDILHNNVGVSIAGGDKPLEELTEEDFDRCNAINLRGMIMTCKHVVPVMRAQKSGAIVNISSMAVRDRYPLVVYKTSKAGVVALTEQFAYTNAEYGIRSNVILPGLMNTPMAVDTRARELNQPRSEIEAMRDAKVPLGRKMGDAWDVAYAALYLASDEAKFVTGVTLAVDGGASIWLWQ